MKIILFDNTQIEAKIKEESSSISLTMSFSKMSEYTAVFEQLQNSNLCKVRIVYDDNTYSEYTNLKFAGAIMNPVSGKYQVTVTLTSKSEFEIEVALLSETISAGTEETELDITKMQLALAEIFERLVSMEGGV